ncbi:aquaporin AQPAe.a-like [Periplaneta americana]|uniref:aquaporin AQPAe.a-like n=1 Tax=Periplaneta americana TaxID=6978 RepID=UPI0037E79055
MVGFKLDTSIFGPYSGTEIIQRCLAEFLGTFLLVFLGCMATGFEYIMPHVTTFFELSCFNFGLAVMIPVLIFGHISQCNINPAVSLTLAIINVLKPAMAVLYVICQCLGAITGYSVLYGLTPMFHGKTVCVTMVHKDLNVYAGMAMEAIATAVLCFVVCGVFDKRNKGNTDATALKFGFTVAGIAIAEAPWTGTSLNPARSLGPALVTGYWKDHWVYWVGPLAGSIFAAGIYRFVFFIPPPPKETPSDEA